MATNRLKRPSQAALGILWSFRKARRPAAAFRCSYLVLYLQVCTFKRGRAHPIFLGPPHRGSTGVEQQTFLYARDGDTASKAGRAGSIEARRKGASKIFRGLTKDCSFLVAADFPSCIVLMLLLHHQMTGMKQTIFCSVSSAPTHFIVFC